MELQQCGASDQTIMHVLQTLMQQQHQAAPAVQPQQRPVVPHPSAPHLAQALGVGAAADTHLLTGHQNLLLTALCHQPMFSAAASGAGATSWHDEQRTAAVARHMHASQSQSHHGQLSCSCLQ